MGERERAAAFKRAQRAGIFAAEIGQTEADCPYKELEISSYKHGRDQGRWSLRPAWMLGFNNARTAQE